MPTPRRSFDRTERLSAYLEVDLDRKMGVLKSGVVVRTLLVADSGEVRWQQTRTSKELPPGSQLEFVSQIPINTVPAGAYQLYFELHSPDVDLTRRSRAVALTIR